MDDSLIIYSSIFVLVLFVILYKFFSQNFLISLGLPIGLSVLYILFFNYDNIPGEESLEMLTDMPNF